MNTIVERIKQYLEMDTNYAIIINGKYGIGKTHFYKNILSPEVKKIALKKNNTKKFKPVHVSLFGLKSLKEVQSEIFVSLFPYLRGKKIQLAMGITKTILRGIAEYNGFRDISKYINDTGIDADKLLTYDELLICFDDLDRKSSALKPEEILGFINNLVENEGCKVIMIANEEELNRDNQYGSKLREKVIGVSIDYLGDTSNAFDEIILTRYKAPFKTYFAYLKSNKFIIEEAIKQNGNNLRNLVFFLENFSIIFHSLTDLFQKAPQFQFKNEEKLSAVLNFTLGISIEYKMGTLQGKHYENLRNLNIDTFRLDNYVKNLRKDPNREEKKEEEDPFFNNFMSKYYDKIKYLYFNSILQFIVGHSSFRIENLKSELESYFTLEQEIPEHEAIFKNLQYPNCFSLTNHEYNQQTAKMLKYVDKGIYDLSKYPTIFHFASRLDNALGYDLDLLKQRIKNGIVKGKKSFQYVKGLQMYFTFSGSSEFIDYIKNIANFCEETNDLLFEKENELKFNNLFNIFNSNFPNFVDLVRNRSSEYRFIPYWVQFPFTKVYFRILRLNNDEIISLSHLFRERYKKQIPKEIFSEKEFLMKLNSILDRPLKQRKRKNLRNACLNTLSLSIGDCIINFPT